jgi:hypothetical protein
MIRIPLLMLLILVAIDTHAQVNTIETGADTTMDDSLFSTEAAWDYLNEASLNKSLWREEENAFRRDFERLLAHTVEPYDSIALRLSAVDLNSIPVNLTHSLLLDSTQIRWLNDSTFIVDSVGWNKSLMLKVQTKITPPVDFSRLAFPDAETGQQPGSDSALLQPDTIQITVIDTAALEALGVKMFTYVRDNIDPPLDEPWNRRSAHVSHDSAFLVFTDTVVHWEASPSSPFRFLSGQAQLDSLHSAIETLLAYNNERDSIRLLVSDLNGKATPLWISSGRSNSVRFWAKNYKNDSITLWLGNPASNELSLMLEDEINVNRMVKQDLDYLPKNLEELNRELLEMSKLAQDPIFWDYDLTSSFTLNQTYLANWTKGGESSLSTLLDIIGGAIYNNTRANTQWINSVRLNIGTLLTQEKGLRKNNDLFEINSKFNRNASGKIGMSASFYMKSQLAKGFNYPNDSVIVSKFLNPASLTVGIGAEYKPFKNTSINVAPLSYKNTFVLDTSLIDQTKHGIDRDKKSKQELGTQIVVMNKFTAIEDLIVANRLRLFSNYLYKPQNIDIDWEMQLDRKINWFFTIRLNLHLIYDDDVRFTVLDQEDQPVLKPDGSEKKAPKAQFKEFVGLSLLFQF